METYTVSFFGHRHIDDPIPIEAALEKIITSLLKNKPFVEFLVGRDGDFDLLVSSVIHRCQKTIRIDNSAHIWVLPYLTAEYQANEAAYCNYYNEIEISETAASIHYKAAFQSRNKKWLIALIIPFSISKGLTAVLIKLCCSPKSKKCPLSI